MQLALLFLLSAAAMAAAGPVADDDDTGGLIQIMGDDGDLAEVETSTACSRRSHKVYFDIGRRTYIYRYRACYNDANQQLCYDARQRLPRYCPYFFRGEDCVGIEWKIHGYTKYFEICDRFGKPCQKRIFGLRRSNSNGECINYYKDLESAKTMGGASEDCLCMIKNGKKKCEGKMCNSA